MSTINKDRDMIISKNIDISVCDCENDINEATKWIIKWIDSDEFQSGDTKLELRVDTVWRRYDITLYRDGQDIYVWIDGNFAYSIDCNAGGLRTFIFQLFKNWRGVPGIQMEYRGDYSDPLLHWCGITANYRKIEDYLYDDFIDGLKDSNQYDEYVQQRRSWQDKKFNNWLFNHYCRIVEIFLQLRDIDVRKNTD